VSSVDIVGADQAPPPPLDDEQLSGGIRGVRERAWLNLRTGNLGAIPIIVGEVAVVMIFAFTATNFFTAVNFVNLIEQTAGTCMLAYGVVFVLLLGEIDLSIGYLAATGAIIVAELQLPGRSLQTNGLLAMLIAIVACAAYGAVQGSIVAYLRVPSFVVTLASYLILSGLVLIVLQQRGSIVIQDRWVNYTDLYIFSATWGWVIAAVFSAVYPLAMLYKKIVARGTLSAQQSWAMTIVKSVGIAIAAFGTVAICNHGKIIATPEGLPLAGVIMAFFFVVLTFLAKWTTFGRHVYAVGGNKEAARRAGINVPRILIIVFAISGAMAAIGGIVFAAQVNSVGLTFPPGNLLLDAIASAVIGGVSLFGGRGEVRGALLGAILIGTLQNGLLLLSLSNGWIYIVTGFVLLGAVTLDTVAVRLQKRSGR
jgi:D-xylose transport system permease protein